MKTGQQGRSVQRESFVIPSSVVPEAQIHSAHPDRQRAKLAKRIGEDKSRHQRFFKMPNPRDQPRFFRSLRLSRCCSLCASIFTLRDSCWRYHRLHSDFNRDLLDVD